ncbi:60S ribosomal protein L29-like [Artibeus jamaicensis]|uniref:60S ribosomal protein L29-like n=1 Tax=Artibeus jamaicensis TaxID=9417 RepID=UPI00235AE465|nr:60S ribosomal protein L29-like [Artibeus jamaicensis]
MAKSKNHSTYNESQKWSRKGIEKLQSQNHTSLQRVDLKFLSNTCFAKKLKKGLKKMQAQETEVMSTHAAALKALVKPKEVRPKIVEGSSHKLNHLAYIAHPKLGKHAYAHITKTRVDLKTKAVIRDKERHFIMIQDQSKKRI